MVVTNGVSYRSCSTSSRISQLVALLPLTAIARIQASCPGLAHFHKLSDTLTFAWDVKYGTKDNKSVLHVCMESQSEGWLGWGISSDGMMIGAEAVIGLPDDGTVLKYNLNGKSSSKVIAMNSTYQTLLNTKIEQKGGVTTLSFEKILEEEGQLPIVPGQNNTFIFAEATANAFGYHGSSRGNFTLFIEEPPKPTPRPTLVKSDKTKSSKSLSEASKSSKPEQDKVGKSIKVEPSNKSGKSYYSGKSGKARKQI